jgi:large subunit ribosomal protein L25
MASVQQMKAYARPKAGKGAARAARYSGRVPGVIYGENKPPVMVLIEHDELKKRIYAGRFLTTLYEIDVEGERHRVIPRDFQLDVIKDLPMHVDFLRVSEGAIIRVKIPVHVLNSDQSPGVKRGGAVNIVTHTVDVMCPADAIPESIDVDIAGLEISHSKHLSDVTLPAGIRVLGREDMTLVTVVPPSGYAEEMKAAAEAAAAAAAAAIAAAPGLEGAAPGAAPAAPGAAPAAPGAAPGAAPAAGGAAPKTEKK